MDDLETLSLDYGRVERAIRYIVQHRLQQPTLEEIADAAHLSPYHFQRTFTRWAGVSPKRFLGFLTMNHAREMLEGSASVLETALETGLSGPGRLHDLFVTFEAATPGQVKARGDGMTIRYGIHDSPFGAVLIATTERGICRLSFLDGRSEEEAVAEVARRWPAARLTAAPEETGALARRTFGPREEGERPLRVHLTGTNFQIKVWEAILRLPLGRLATYGQVGEAIGCPSAARAIGNALNANPVAFLIPCHSVVPALRQASVFARYQAGAARRAAIIGWEAAMVLGENSRRPAGPVQEKPSTSRIL